MKYQNKYWIAFLLIVLFSACNCNVQSDEQIIKETERKFPKLKSGSHNPTNDYSFFKSITLANPAVQIKLFKPPKMYNNYQGLIIITNSKGLSYPIPLLDNQYKGYWGFLFDKTSKQDGSTQTTFEKETNKALNALGLNRGYDGSTIICELFNSILDCKQLGDDDLNVTKKTINFDDEAGLANENTDSCGKRDRLNYEDISKLMHPRKYEIDENAFFDSKNDRIYQLNFSRFPKASKKYYKIIAYRQGCVAHPITL